MANISKTDIKELEQAIIERNFYDACLVTEIHNLVYDLMTEEERYSYTKGQGVIGKYGGPGVEGYNPDMDKRTKIQIFDECKNRVANPNTMIKGVKHLLSYITECRNNDTPNQKGKGV